MKESFRQASQAREWESQLEAEESVSSCCSSLRLDEDRSWNASKMYYVERILFLPEAGETIGCTEAMTKEGICGSGKERPG